MVFTLGNLCNNEVGMAARLAVLVVVFAAIACGLLALRQARLQAAHELAVSQRRVQEIETDLWRVNADIAEKLSPERIEGLIEQSGTRFGAVTLWEFERGELDGDADGEPDREPRSGRPGEERGEEPSEEVVTDAAE